ncbi:uncharacterized protein LOC131218989 isoform X1 [Magnolia sinica]|uniref:uncharacterized protein LOC131218989 isoform X1 n=1 Tax=Magnolia sinica TaxID=86752 RepID=UPI002657E8F9|nr:uncharacterized protein LOC131218989 isoform X1 [Magnolia sinica]
MSGVGFWVLAIAVGTALTFLACSGYFPGWFLEMEEEFVAVLHNNTWDLIPQSPTMNLVGCKWVFKTKLHSNGTLEHLKARLIPKGFNQIPDSVFHDNEERVLTMPTHRKLKERIYKLNGVLKKKRDLSSVNLEDYRPVDPVPSSKASIKPGPTPHGTPLIPYIPQPTPPNHPGPKHGGSP